MIDLRLPNRLVFFSWLVSAKSAVVGSSGSGLEKAAHGPGALPAG
jgi:hypothetical protein